MRRAALLTTVVLAIAGCDGGDDDDAADEPGTTTTSASGAQGCVGSWNAEGNDAFHSALAGVISATGAPPGELRVGTWPKGGDTTPAWKAEDAFGATRRNSRQITVGADSCVVVVPQTHAGLFVFVESEGSWHFVQNELSGFPRAASRSLADAADATADALGKLELK